MYRRASRGQCGRDHRWLHSARLQMASALPLSHSGGSLLSSSLPQGMWRCSQRWDRLSVCLRAAASSWLHTLTWVSHVWMRALNALLLVQSCRSSWPAAVLSPMRGLGRLLKADTLLMQAAIKRITSHLGMLSHMTTEDSRQVSCSCTLRAHCGLVELQEHRLAQSDLPRWRSMQLLICCCSAPFLLHKNKLCDFALQAYSSDPVEVASAGTSQLLRKIGV